MNLYVGYIDSASRIVLESSVAYSCILIIDRFPYCTGNFVICREKLFEHPQIVCHLGVERAASTSRSLHVIRRVVYVGKVDAVVVYEPVLPVFGHYYQWLERYQLIVVHCQALSTFTHTFLVPRYAIDAVRTLSLSATVS